jgi:adenine-specific DNA-methyltransferase
VRYFGSKGSVVETVYRLGSKQFPMGTLCDPFGGIGVVGACFKSHGHVVTTGDHLQAAHCFQCATVAAQRQSSFSRVQRALGLEGRRSVVAYLNCLESRKGWLIAEYSQNRQFFTKANAKKIEGCRQVIEDWNTQGLLSSQEHRILLASLINSMDRVANTAGTYYAYLKKWYRKALREFEFRLLPPTPGPNGCRAVLADAADLVGRQPFDILYLDPPYNHRDYAAYYHLPESIARSETPLVGGRAGIPRVTRPKSEFSCRNSAFDALKRLLTVSRFGMLIFHYSDAGLINRMDLVHLLRSLGRMNCHKLSALGYNTCVSKPRRVDHLLYTVYNA